MESITLLALLIGTVLIAGISKRVRGTMVTLPMLYTLFGLLVALLFSDRIDITYDNPGVELIATLTLVLVLATDASRISLRTVRTFYNLPLRLLGYKRGRQQAGTRPHSPGAQLRERAERRYRHALAGALHRAGALAIEQHR